MERSRVTRYAAPVAFLAAVTIGALVVRAGFEHGKQHATPTTTATQTTKTKKKKHSHAHKPGPGRRYTVQSGDTLESIATREGTTVARLEQLNPGVDPTALRVGQKIRVQ
ncbi:MAG TPA: LysM domain-containing protein [Gaiellaceae bacterium]|nr:LysM domain-containing protein [Gaiellaceae bacterium]